MSLQNPSGSAAGPDLPGDDRDESELELLDFLTERDDWTGSWQRAENDDALLEWVSRHVWQVFMGGDVHRVTIAKSERWGYVGHCPCDGFRWHDGPCAHLCAVRRAESRGEDDDRGVPVQVAPMADERRRGRERAERERAAGRHEVVR